MPFPRKHIRLNPAMYVGQSWYFVTMCSVGRRRVFANSCNAIDVVEAVRKHSIAHWFAVHAYCVMPDHFHGLFSGMEPASDLLAFVKNIKKTTSCAYRVRRGETLWQKKFYDHILKARDNPAGVAAYIWMNPVRKGLCSDARDYPFSGSFTLDWKTAIAPAEPWTPAWKKKMPA